MGFNFGVIAKYGPYLVKGLYWTMAITGASVGVGAGLGLLICLCKLSSLRLLRYAAEFYIQLFRNIPRLVILIYVYFCTGIFLDIQVKALPAAIIAFSLLTSAYMAEIFRAGIVGVDKREIEAAKGLGMSSFQVYRRVVLPQAVRTTIPPFVNQIVATSKTTTIASMIGVPELLYRARAMSTRSFRPLELYTVMGLIYVLVLLILSYVARLLEKKLTYYR